jgi:hypothetical protein
MEVLWDIRRGCWLPIFFEVLITSIFWAQKAQEEWNVYQSTRRHVAEA